MYTIHSLATRNSQTVHKTCTKFQLLPQHPSASRAQARHWLPKHLSFQSLPNFYRVIQHFSCQRYLTECRHVRGAVTAGEGGRPSSRVLSSAPPRKLWGYGVLGTSVVCCLVKYLLFLARLKLLTLAAMKSFGLIFCCAEPCIDVYPSSEWMLDLNAGCKDTWPSLYPRINNYAWCKATKN